MWRTLRPPTDIPVPNRGCCTRFLANCLNCEHVSPCESPDARPRSTVSEELFAPVGRGIELCYQTFGDPDDDPLLLVMGLGGPMTWWDPELCEALARRRFLRRPLRQPRHRPLHGAGGPGHASHAGPRLRGHPGAGAVRHRRPGRRRLRAARPPRARRPRTSSGVSMGGMIVQTMAIDHPGRVRSLTSIMSTTGKRTVGWQHPALLPRLLAAPQARAGGLRREPAPTFGRLIGSPGLPRSRRGGREARRRDLRPRDQRQRRAAADAGRAHPAEPERAGCAASGSRPWSSTASPTRWCTSPAAGRPPPPSRAPSCCSSTGWATTCRPTLFETFVERHPAYRRQRGPDRPSRRRLARHAAEYWRRRAGSCADSALSRRGAPRCRCRTRARCAGRS